MRFSGKRSIWPRFESSVKDCKGIQDPDGVHNKNRSHTEKLEGETSVDQLKEGHVENVEKVIRFTEEEKPIARNGDSWRKSDFVFDANNYSAPKQAHWLRRRVYILTWIRSYSREMAISDLIAGITLGMTIIPQSIAYASLAGLSSEYGLYSAFIGSFIYVFFGTIPQVSIGPTSLMALLVLQFCADKPVQFVIVLAFLAGLVELLMGVFQLGFIVSFIPNPVTKAFTTGTSTIVILVQIKNLLGVKLKGLPSLTAFWNSIRPGDAVMGFTCIAILLCLKMLGQVKFRNDTITTRRIKKLLWYVSISRNALVVFFSSLLAFFWIHRHSIESVPFALSAKVNSTMPSLQLPPFVFDYNNVTYVFTDICRELGSAIIVAPIVAVLASVAIAKAFVKDGNLDATQEMLALGLCNLAGSFFSAMPVCGAFTRSAVSQASGVRTPMAGIYTGVLVLSALSILTPYFQYIPKSALSAVLIAAVIFMVDFSPLLQLWRSNKKDFFSWVGSFVVCILAGVQMGLFFGIVVNMAFVLLRIGNPKVDADVRECDGIPYIHVVPRSDIYYTGVEFLRSKVRAACCYYRHDFPVVLDCGRFMQFDSTFVDALNALAKELDVQNVQLVLHFMSAKQQQLMPELPTNLSFCNEALSSGILKQKK